MSNFEKNFFLILMAFYQNKIAELKEENKKNKALIALLEGFIDGKRFIG